MITYSEHEEDQIQVEAIVLHFKITLARKEGLHHSAGCTLRARRATAFSHFDTF